MLTSTLTPLALACAESVADEGPGLLEWMVLGGVVCLVGLGIFLISRGYKRWKQSQEEAREMEQAFFEQAERETNLLLSGQKPLDAGGGEGWPGDPARELPRSVPANSASAAAGSAAFPASASGEPSAAPPPVAPGGTGGAAPSGSETFEGFISRLRQLGILEAMEGRVELPPPSPPGQIHRLRGGGLALVIDQLESERFLSFQAQRFRVVIVRGSEGKPLVLRRFEDFLTEQLAGPEG
jgi:hypothetical protein